MITLREVLNVNKKPSKSGQCDEIEESRSGAQQG